jgi:hypothetical protein
MDVYAIVTEKIVNLLEQGIVPWRRPWSATGLPRNLVSKKRYRGVNLFLLSPTKYVSPFWLTMKQANEVGGSVRKGEHSQMARIPDPWINIYKVQELLFRFCGPTRPGVNAGYMFTLNQDLWPERYIFNEHVSGAPHPSLPGLRRRPNQRLFTTDIGNYSDDFLMQPVEEPAANGQLLNQFNVIKLHGSFNWRTVDARPELVMGAEKGGQIAASPLLTWYFDIFRKVLSAGGVRLMVAGYGFGDEHVNSIIADAIERCGLRVFIWDTCANLKGCVLAAPRGSSLWSGLLSTMSRLMIEVFPSNQAETQEYQRIRETFFA